MPNDFYDIDMMQTLNDIAEELDKKNVSRKELLKELEDGVYKLLDGAEEKGRKLAKCSTFNVKVLGEIIAKFLTDTENKKFYFKQIKIEYNHACYYDGFNGFNEQEIQYFAEISHTHNVLFYNTIAYDNINENKIYSLKELKELTCFEYHSYPSDIIEIYNCYIPFDEYKLNLDKHPNFTLENKTNAIDSRIKIIEFVDTLINYRIYHNLENITKEELANFEQEYVLKYNKKEDNSRKLTK